MSTGLIVTLERNGKKLKLDLEECSQADLIEYFSKMPPEDVRDWVYLLAGYVKGSAAKLKELREQAVTLTGLLGKTQKQRDFALKNQ